MNMLSLIGFVPLIPLVVLLVIDSQLPIKTYSFKRNINTRFISNISLIVWEHILIFIMAHFIPNGVIKFPDRFPIWLLYFLFILYFFLLLSLTYYVDSKSWKRFEEYFKSHKSEHLKWIEENKPYAKGYTWFFSFYMTIITALYTLLYFAFMIFGFDII